jgi:hypothetical protein
MHKSITDKKMHFNFTDVLLLRGPGISVGIATDYELDGPGIEFR